MTRNGFTLVELVVVMVLLGILSSLAVYSLGGTMDRHRMSTAIESIEMFDAAARRAARSSQQRVVAAIDRSAGRLSIQSPTNREAISFTLAPQITIAQIRVAGNRGLPGDAQINVNGEGRSPSYAIELQRGALKQWLVVLGFSGQVVTLRNEGEVNAILSQ